MYTWCDLELECVFASDLCATFACTLCLGQYADKSGNTQVLRKDKEGACALEMIWNNTITRNKHTEMHTITWISVGKWREQWTWSLLDSRAKSIQERFCHYRFWIYTIWHFLNEVQGYFSSLAWTQNYVTRVIEKGVHTFQYGHSRFRVPVLHIFTLPKLLLQPATCHSCFLAKTCGSRLHGMIHVCVHMSAYTYTLYNQIHSMLHRRHIFIHDSLNVYRYDCIFTNRIYM